VTVTPGPIALTMGEPAGIGGEITIQAWISRHSNVPAFFVIDDADRLEQLAASLGVQVPIERIDNPSAAHAVYADALPVLHMPLPRHPAPGHPDPVNASAVIHSIELAAQLANDGKAGAMVTNPIHKKALYDSGFAFPGHTEFLAHLAGLKQPPVMMLASPQLKVVPVTVHTALKQAIADLATDAIVHTAIVAHKALIHDFGINQPRLVLAGLNPHAGEDGSLGDEEQRIIKPAVTQLRAFGLAVKGPASPDSLFSTQARQSYDAAICMYHDQALIPIKALDFDGGVNITLGLPFLRTSPDHGTALDIAGTGQARSDSLIAAIRMANFMAHRRLA